MNLFLRVALIGSAFFGAAQVYASSVTYALNMSNDLGDGPTYATVTLSDGVAGNIDFSVQVIESAFPAPLSNFGMQSFFFNYNNSLTISKSNITNMNPASWDIREEKNAGGDFGLFAFNAVGTGSTRISLLTFSIAGVAGDTIADYALGYAGWTSEFFAAHIAGYNDSTSGNSSGKFAGSTVVPVPAAIWLFGSGLGLLGWFRRKKS